MNAPVPTSTPRTELKHRRLYDAAKAALLKFFVHPYASVCELYCGSGIEAERWEEAHIDHYMGIDTAASGVAERREAWESLRKCYTTALFQIDPCTLCFESEDKARKLLYNVSSLLKPGGYFFGITPDSSTIWAKYQKNVEAYHNRISSMKPGIVPNCIRSESYMITFEVEEEKFPSFGKKYQLIFAGEISGINHCLIHFPSLIRLAREGGLKYIEIQNLTEFYDDDRAIFSRILAGSVSNFVDPRGRLLPRSYDLLETDPDAGPPLTTPLLLNRKQFEDEREMSERRDDDSVIPMEPAPGLGKISEQKGILGPVHLIYAFPRPWEQDESRRQDYISVETLRLVPSLVLLFHFFNEKFRCSYCLTWIEQIRENKQPVCMMIKLA